MKSVVVASITILAATASAAAVATPDTVTDATTFCNSKDQACDKLNKAADAAAGFLTFNETMPEGHAEQAAAFWCEYPGNGCFKAKRAATALADAISDAYTVTKRDADPEPRRWGWWNGPKKRDADPAPRHWGWWNGPKVKRDAEAEAAPWHWYYGPKVKRDAEAEAAPWRWWMGPKSKRDAEAEPGRWYYGPKVKRDAEAEAEAEAEATQWRWWNGPKAKRDNVEAEAQVDTYPPFPEPWFGADMVAEAFADKEGQHRAQVKRAATAIANALAQEPEASSPELSRRTSAVDPAAAFCHSSGQPCDVAKRAAAQLSKAADEAMASL